MNNNGESGRTFLLSYGFPEEWFRESFDKDKLQWMQDNLQLPPGWKLEGDFVRSDYILLRVNIITRDAYDPGKEVVIQVSDVIYNVGSCMSVIHGVQNVLHEAAVHELKEWCKVGDRHLFGDPHG